MTDHGGVDQALAQTVMDALVASICGDRDKAYDCLERVAARTRPSGAELSGACFAWATAIKLLENLDDVITEVVRLDGHAPDQAKQDRVTNVAAYIAAVANGDDNGAVTLWYRLPPEDSITLTWDILSIAGLCGRALMEREAR